MSAIPEKTHSSKTRVLLCQPWDCCDEGRPDAKHHLGERWTLPNYGLVLLATMAKQAGHNVRMFDAEVELVLKGSGDQDHILKRRIAQLISEFHPDIVGISCFSARWPEAYKMAKAFNDQRKSKNDFKIIFGGFHPTTQFKEVFEQAPFVDWIHVGESEKSFMEVLNGADPKTVAGIAWKDNGIVHHSECQPADLDSLPFPDWNFLDASYYFCPSKTVFQFYPRPYRIYPFIYTRGCVYNCAYCTHKYQIFRMSSKEYVGGYLDYLLKNYPAQAFIAYDSFLGGKSLHSLCEAVLERGMDKKLAWSCALRTNTTQKQDIIKLKKANCCIVHYGFESGSDRILKLMNKKSSVEEGLKVAQYHHEVGLPFGACIMFGYPSETREDALLSQKFIEQAKPYAGGTINVFAPTPGSAVFDDLMASGKIRINGPEDYRKYSLFGTSGHANFTAMDNETYAKTLVQLRAALEDVTTASKRGWILGQAAKDLFKDDPQDPEAMTASPLIFDVSRKAREKAEMVRGRFNAAGIRDIRREKLRDHLREVADLPDLADFLWGMEGVEQRWKACPVGSFLLDWFIYPMFRLMFFVYVRIPSFLRKNLPWRKAVMRVLKLLA
ncbi:B12-binding domain-containing radical SAM protein [Elusimicrobiota bacterium]